MGMPNGTSLCTEASWARPPLSYALDALAAPIIETVVTTINPDGSVNCGAMGVEWGEQRIVIKPYGGTGRCANRGATGGAAGTRPAVSRPFGRPRPGAPQPPGPPRPGAGGPGRAA